MSEAEKQEGQKTVVAFITGLLIGGLLVWVFSSTPETAPQTENEEVTTEEQTNNDQAAEEEDAAPSVSTDGNGSLNVANQKAGDVVNLGSVTYPSENGWIVVRDYTDNVAGRILGAARYSTEEGLTPNTVSLLRNTEAGKTYQVVFYTESGDKKFSTANDTAVEAGAVTFKAE